MEKEICHFCTPTQDENILVGRYCLESDPIQFIIEKLEPQTGNVIWSTTGENLIENINVWEFDLFNAEIMGQYLLISDISNENLFLLDTKNGSRIWAYSSNSDKNYTLKQNNNKNIFFVEQHQTNTILCFQVEEG